MDTKHVSRGAAQPLNFEPRAGADHARANGPHQITSPQQLPLQVSMARTAAATPGTSVAQRGPLVVAPRKKGFNPTQVQQFVDSGGDKKSALQYARTGATPTQTMALHQAKISPNEAIEFEKLGITPQEVLHWSKTSVNLASPVASTLRQQGYTDIQIRGFVSLGCKPELTARYHGMGATPLEAIAYQRVGLSPENAAEFKKLGFNAPQALRWNTSRNGLELAQTFRQSFSPQQSFAFYRQGFSPEQAKFVGPLKE